MKLLPVLCLVQAGVLAQGIKEPPPPVPQPPPAGQAVLFEDPPVLKASEILKPEFLSGDGWKVREDVPTWAGRNSYVLETEFGVFDIEGNAMLTKRIGEIAAIRQLKSISKSDEYKAALKAAAKSPLVFAKGLVEHPVKTVTGIPKGIFKMIGRAGNSIKNAAQERPQNPYEDSATEQMIGFSKAKRELAAKLGVDPYSSNPALQEELNGHAWTTYAGKMTFAIATIPVGGAVGGALTASNVTTTFNGVLRDKSPADLRIMNEGLLQRMGCTTAEAENFLGNNAFPPSAQTAFVLNLGELHGVSDIPQIVNLATRTAADESDALFFVETSRILAHIHTRDVPLEAIGAFDFLPYAWGKDGRVIFAVEWDYASWTERAADFISRLKAVEFPHKQPAGFVFALSGAASPLAAENLKKMNIGLSTFISPGPVRQSSK
jgi:hypothetical protein